MVLKYWPNWWTLMILKPIEHMAWYLLFHWTKLVQAWLCMGHDHFTRLFCCLGHENGCFLSAHLSIDDHAKFCKLPQVLGNSCSAEFSSRISYTFVLQSEQVSPFVSAWLNAPCAIVVVCSCDSSIGLMAYWSKVHMTINIIFSYNPPMPPNCSLFGSDVAVTACVRALSARDWHRYWHRSGGW